jgi:hypothetical protein
MAIITFLTSYNSEHVCECAYLKLEYAFLLIVECCDKKLQKYICYFTMSICQHKTVQVPQNMCSLNLMVGVFLQFCQPVPVLVKTWQK